MWKFSINKLKNLFRIGYLKTIYVNFRLLPFKQAIFFPLVVTRKTTIESVRGSVILSCPAKFALIRFGFFNSDFYSWDGNKTLLNINGNFIIHGNIQFGVGCCIVIDKGASLEMSGNTCIGALTKIICREKIKTGESFRMAWESQLMDTNFHYTKNTSNGKVYRKTKPIVIGNNNWIGNRSSIMQGTATPNFFIVASNSLCNKDYTSLAPEYSIIGGSPAKLLKTGLYRVLDQEEKAINQLFDNTNAPWIFVDKVIK